MRVISFLLLAMAPLPCAGAGPMFPPSRSDSSLVPGAVRVNSLDNLKYVWIPPGRFMMGCSPGDIDCDKWERPAHEVTISNGFWLGQIEVPQVAYESIMAPDNPSRLKGSVLPVVMVIWYVAQEKCNELKCRFPTEAEWEYAARAGTPESRYGLPEQVAWFGGTAETPPHPGGQKPANAWNLYDMLGNVWEWVADYDSPYSSASVVDPRGPDTGNARPVRGGSLFNRRQDVRASRRYQTLLNFHDGTPFRNRFLGFRCAGESR
jgi:formylglycine-generating enzyme required for sulfatase activity